MSDEKNQTLETRKKAEEVFIPDLHSHPELMSYSEKLELAEEIVAEVLASYLDSEGLKAQVLDVEGSEIRLSLAGGSLEHSVELQSMVKEATNGVFSLEVQLD